MVYRIGVTGHRKLLRKEVEVREAVKEKLKAIREVHSDLEVNTGMALGFDQLVCDACIELGIPFVAAVPCDAQDSLWSVTQKARYALLLEQATRVVQVTPGGYEPWKMHARNGWIVTNSDEMVVYWDGFYQGGTGGCMKIVRSKKLPFHNIFKSPE